MVSGAGSGCDPGLLCSLSMGWGGRVVPMALSLAAAGGHVCRPPPPTPGGLSPVSLALSPRSGLFSKPSKTVVLRVGQCPLSSPRADASFPFSVGAACFFPLLMFCVFLGVRSAFDEDW